MHGTASVPVLDAQHVHLKLSFPKLFEALEAAFRAPALTIPRQALPYQRTGDADPTTLLLMAAVNPDALGGVKIVTFNAGRKNGSVSYIYIVFDAATGAPVALLDGEALSSRRTAAVSVTAARKLARADSRSLLILGNGAVAGELVAAYAAGFPGIAISVWGRRREATEAFAARLAVTGHEVAVVEDLPRALGQADIVSSATAATSPLIQGDLVRAGTHIDLIGGFSRTMRESDDAAIRRANVRIVDNDAAIREAGDLVQPIESGVISAGDIATLTQLLRGEVGGRTSPADITFFKSVGHSLADLAAAQLVLTH
jgi:ornithine cyclodeaminase